MKFTRAIVRTPCERLSEGLSSAALGRADYDLAMVQHQKYIEALQYCGLDVRVLAPDREYPDSTFVEDTALLIPNAAIITRPGASSRRGETESMHEVLKNYFDNIHQIDAPGTLEAGDVMMTGSHFYIGISDRTNAEGATQLISILEKYGMTGSAVEINGMLHLKSGVSYLENNTLLVVSMLETHFAFSGMDIIPVPLQESYAANSLWVNGHVLVPEGFPVTLRNIISAGYDPIVLNMSEFRKLDGGLSCLSLRF